MVGRRVLALYVAVGTVFSVAGCGSSSGQPRADAATCHYTAYGTAARNVGLPPSTPKSATHLTLSMLVGTSKTPEPIAITLTPRTAPCTVNSVRFLAGAKYFDNTSCQRLTTQGIYVLQCGNPNGIGGGGPGYQFADELSGTERYTAGTVAMANSGPNTNGSQFFLVYRDSRLPPSYTVFGHLTGGLPVLLREARGGSVSQNAPGDGPPLIPIRIATARTG